MVVAVPHLIYPATHAAFTASILLTVALALERHSAIYKPIEYSMVRDNAIIINNQRPFNLIHNKIRLDLTCKITKKKHPKRLFLPHSQATNHPSGPGRRLTRYLLPVLVLSLLFNATKFLEGKIVWPQDEEGKFISWSQLVTNICLFLGEAKLGVTDLRIHPLYSAYANWSRLMIDN